MGRLRDMVRWAAWVLLLVLAMPAGGVFGSPCDFSAPSAMPCCQRSMPDCGHPTEPGMTPVQDCCRMVPGSAEPPLVSLHEAAQDGGSWLRWSLAPVSGWIGGGEIPCPEVRKTGSPALRRHVPPSSARTIVLLI